MSQYIIGLIENIYAASMSYVAAKYFILIAITVLAYYVVPKKIRWVMLLGSSAYFYYEISSDKKQLVILVASIVISYASALLIQHQGQRKDTDKVKKLTLAVGIVFSAAPLIASKCGDFITSSIIHRSALSWIIPVGLSFYSMQIISYLIDVYRGKYEPQKNVFKYALYVSFFPIVIQGPISRYNQLSKSLYEGHEYDNENLMRGIQLILWGLFLKYLIADKASVVVDTVFNNYQNYSGCYVWIAAILYSVQLYTDFLSCVMMSKGVGEMFGVEITDNFKQPYFSTSIKDFWRRWHISLSEWLRDYVYISLGGNRKGKLHKYINLIITFAVSGIWHGGRWKYLFWGLMHAGYQIVGDLVYKPKNSILEKISLPRESKTRRFLEMLVTSFLVMIAWIIFRADSLKAGIKMIISMFSTFNPWILFNSAVFWLGLNQREFEVLGISILILVIVSLLHERNIKIRDWFNKQNFVIRWIVYLCVIWSIWIFGTYGYGFNAADFIYGDF